MNAAPPLACLIALAGSELFSIGMCARSLLLFYARLL